MSPWKQAEFRFAGIDLVQKDDMSTVLYQQFYSDERSLLENIPQQGDTGVVFVMDRKAIRSKLGALQWLAVRTRPTPMARTNLLLSEVRVGGPPAF